MVPLFTLGYDVEVISWVKHIKETRPPVYAVFHFIAPFIDLTGYGGFQIAAILVLLVFGRFLSAKARFAGKTLLAGFLASGISVQVLKHLIGRARPRIIEGVQFIGPSMKGGFDSFPSGHTTVAFCLAYVLSRNFPRYAVLFYLLAVFVGVERVLLEAHFFSDVLEGAFLGVLVGQVLWVKFVKNPEKFPSFRLK
ncbi:MAG: phosphatase PAP2 family protein [Nitrospiraceae bacterium]|nr:phosphatase PAP2 family protein [Nitrospiraceae bacterium]